MKGNFLPIILVVACVALAAWVLSRPSPWQIAPPLENVPKVSVQMAAPIKVYAGVSKAKLNLPAAILAAPNKHIADATRVKPDQRPQTIVTVVDSETGDVETIIRKEPLPWIARQQTGEMRIDSGIKNGARRVGRISLTQDVLQIKALHLGMRASLDTDGQYFVGVGVSWKW